VPWPPLARCFLILPVPCVCVSEPSHERFRGIRRIASPLGELLVLPFEYRSESPSQHGFPRRHGGCFCRRTCSRLCVCIRLGLHIARRAPPLIVNHLPDDVIHEVSVFVPSFHMARVVPVRVARLCHCELRATKVVGSFVVRVEDIRWQLVSVRFRPDPETPAARARDEKETLAS